jgi:hypothetical protein
MTEFCIRADLETLLAAIAASPIVVLAGIVDVVPTGTTADKPEPRDFTEWCALQAPDVDLVILDWLRAQAPRRSALV